MCSVGAAKARRIMFHFAPNDPVGRSLVPQLQQCTCRWLLSWRLMFENVALTLADYICYGGGLDKEKKPSTSIGIHFE